MRVGDPLGPVEFAVLQAVHRSALAPRRGARQIRVLDGQPAAQTILHDALRGCEQHGLLRSQRDTTGRRFELTPAGRARLRAERGFRAALLGVLLRS